MDYPRDYPGTTPALPQDCPRDYPRDKPSLGRIVLCLVDPARNNGADVAPAIITRVWSDTSINVRVLRDALGELDWRAFIPLWPSRSDMEAHHAALIADGRMPTGTRPTGAFWPPQDKE